MERTEVRLCENTSTKLMLWDFRTPVVIFLSDGECSLSDAIMYDLCRAAVKAGYVYFISPLVHKLTKTLDPLFHSTPFHLA